MRPAVREKEILEEFFDISCCSNLAGRNSWKIRIFTRSPCSHSNWLRSKSKRVLWVKLQITHERALSGRIFFLCNQKHGREMEKELTLPHLSQKRVLNQLVKWFNVLRYHFTSTVLANEQRQYNFPLLFKSYIISARRARQSRNEKCKEGRRVWIVDWIE